MTSRKSSGFGTKKIQNITFSQLMLVSDKKMISRQWPSSIGSFKASLPKPSAVNPATFELEVNVPLTGAAGSLPGYN